MGLLFLILQLMALAKISLEVVANAFQDSLVLIAIVVVQDLRRLKFLGFKALSA